MYREKIINLISSFRSFAFNSMFDVFIKRNTRLLASPESARETTLLKKKKMETKEQASCAALFMCACQLIDINFYCLTRNTSHFTDSFILMMKWLGRRKGKRVEEQRKRIISKELSLNAVVSCERLLISTHNARTLPNITRLQLNRK